MLKNSKKFYKEIINKILNLFNLSIVDNREYKKIQNKSHSYDHLEFLKLTKEKNIKKILNILNFSKSQTGQDLFVLDQLDFKENGFFCEFGACDGIKISNSYLLEKKFNWSGVLCEPNKFYHTELHANRSCSIEEKCVYIDSGSYVQFNDPEDKAFSTIQKYWKDDQHKDLRKQSNIYKVQTISINDLLKKYKAPKNFDYLSIDTEGSEYDIIKNLDLNAYNPKIITIEHNFQVEKRKNIFNFLSEHKYKRIFNEISKVDDWYVL